MVAEDMMDTHKVRKIKQYQQKNTDKKEKKTDVYANAVMFLCIAVIIIIAAGYIYINGYEAVLGHLLRENIGGTQASVSVQTGVNYHFDTYHNDVVQCSRDGIKVIDRNGQHAWSVAMNLSQPFMQVTSRGIMVADRGGHEVHLITNRNHIELIKTDNPIITARMNDSGYVAIVTEARGYQARVTVYTPDAAPFYIWHSMRNVIIDVDVSLDGKKMVASVLDTSKGHLSAGVMFFNLHEEVPYAAKELEDMIVSNIYIRGEQTVIAVADNQMRSFTLADGSTNWQQGYEGMILQSYAVSDNNDIVIALQDKKSGGLFKTSNKIVIYDIAGRERGSFEIDGNVESLDIKDNVVVFNVKRDIYIITPRGEKIAKHTVTKDIKLIKLFANKRHIILISGADMEIISIR